MREGEPWALNSCKVVSNIVFHMQYAKDSSFPHRGEKPLNDEIVHPLRGFTKASSMKIYWQILCLLVLLVHP